MQRSDDDNARSPLFKLLIIVTLLTVVVALWYLLDYYLRGSSQDTTWYPPSTPCDLTQSACHADLGMRAELWLTLGEEPVPLDPLDIDVRVQGIEAERVVVDFIGRNMNMGINRFVLSDQGNGHFKGQGQLGVCSVDEMPWRAQVLIETADGRRGSWFDFEVKRRSI